MENIDYIVLAEGLLAEMKRMVQLYERGTIQGTNDFWFELTPTQVNQLKSAFATKRTALKAAVDSITAS